jgi:hypothetical protein
VAEEDRGTREPRGDFDEERDLRLRHAIAHVGEFGMAVGRGAAEAG